MRIDAQPTESIGALLRKAYAQRHFESRIHSGPEYHASEADWALTHARSFPHTVHRSEFPSPVNPLIP